MFSKMKKSENFQGKGFFSYIISHDSEKAAGILSSFVLKKTRQNLKYSFEVILNYYFVKCKSIKRISAFVVNFVYRLKEKSFLSIKKYSESWIFKQKFSDFLF